MSTPQTIAVGLESVFQRIERTAMAGVPMVNPALSVKAVGVRDWHDEWLAVLVTPWFMNLVLLPRAGVNPGAPPATTGEKRHVAFPAGRFEFIHAYEEELGPYSMCSLFSPMFEFIDQQSAEATASHVLVELLTAVGADDEDRDMVRIWEGRLPADETVAHVDEPGAGLAESADAVQSGTRSTAVTRRSLLGLGSAREVGDEP